jgi:hypothetical protein
MEYTFSFSCRLVAMTSGSLVVAVCLPVAESKELRITGTGYQLTPMVIFIIESDARNEKSIAS